MASTYPKKQIENTIGSTGNANKMAPKKPKLNPIKMLCIGERNCEILLKILRIERRQLQFGPICRVIGTDGNDIIQIEGYGKYAERLTSWIKQTDIGKFSYLEHAEVKEIKPDHNYGSVPYVLKIREDTTITVMDECNNAN